MQALEEKLQAASEMGLGLDGNGFGVSQSRQDSKSVIFLHSFSLSPNLMWPMEARIDKQTNKIPQMILDH